MTLSDDQHLAWMARSFGHPDYLPLGPADLEVLEAVAEPISRFVGSHLFRQGEPASAAYLIRDGTVHLYRDHAGRRRVVARVGPGAVLGDIAMFGEGLYLSGARAVTQVRALRFDRDRLVPELARQPALCLRWLVAGLRQLESAHRRIIRLMHGTVVAQVADLILEEAAIHGEVRMSQAEIASLLGTSRQSVNEALASLRDMGAVSTAYRVIRVDDSAALARVVAGDHG
ncbi:MAG: Crp/Fnr family transcriptional regulator [Acidimicrobiia bacterium]